MRPAVLAVAALALAGCASEADRNYADFKTCQARGFEVGSSQYWNCRNAVVNERAADRQLLAARLYALGQAMRDASPPPPADTEPSVPVGFTKICAYNTITGPRAITVSAVSICPLLPPS